MAYRLGEEITWDAEKLEAKNLPEAERYIKKRYRKGWDIHA